MEDKTFDLLTMMYSEFSEFRKDMTGFKSEMTEFKKDMTEFKKDMTEFKKDMTEFRKDITTEVKKIQIKLENEIEPKIQALYEDREIVHSKLDTLEIKVDELKERSDKQEIEIKVIKGGKGKSRRA